MRHIFVQNCETKLLLSDGNAWTADPNQARNFGTSLNALAHCLHNQLLDTQILVRFDTPGAADVVVPVQPDSQDSPDLRP